MILPTFNWFQFVALMYFMIIVSGKGSGSASGLIHYYSEAGSRKCFYKDLDLGSMLVGKYKMEILDPDTGDYYNPRDRINTGILIDVEETFDSNHRVVHQKGASSGQFTFSAIDSGEHRICLTPRTFFKKWQTGGSNDPYIIKDLKFKHARILVDFSITDGALLDSGHSTHVQSINDRITQLNDKLIDIKREQKFIREKEEQFRDLSELTCDRVFRWLIIQFGALFLTCIYQLFTLQRFFIKVKVS